jgi:hypothetical protein
MTGHEMSGNNYAPLVEKIGSAAKGLFSGSSSANDGGFFGRLIGGGNSTLGKWLGLGGGSDAGGTGGLYSAGDFGGGIDGGLGGGIGASDLAGGLGGTGFDFSSLGGSLVGAYHGGGIAGTPSGMQRYVPDWVWATAPRYHTGTAGAGLAPNEVPAVLTRGEKVTPAGAASAGASSIIYAPTNVYASDVGSFRSSSKQLAVSQQRSADRAQSRGS